MTSSHNTSSHYRTRSRDCFELTETPRRNVFANQIDAKSVKPSIGDWYGRISA